MARLILITGPPGIGKTSVAQTLAANLPGVAARLCGDTFILAVTPFKINDDRRLFLRENLASFARHAIDHGYDHVILECVIPSDDFIADLIEDIGPGRGRFAVFSLLASKQAYETRLSDKLRHHDASAVDFGECHLWRERIEALRTPTPIDTSNQTVEVTTADILNRIG